MVAKGPYVGQLIYHCRYSGECEREGAFLMEICGVGNGRAATNRCGLQRWVSLTLGMHRETLCKYLLRKIKYSKNFWAVDNRAYPDMAQVPNLAPLDDYWREIVGAR